MFFKKIKAVIRKAQQKSRRATASREFAQLSSHESPVVRAVGVSLSEALSNRLPPEEQKLIDAIEERRSSLLNSAEEIEIIDYGAGKPDSNRTAEEMAQGVVLTAPVSKIAKASKPAFWAAILFHLVRNVKPKSCVELGTCVGISGAYQAAAMKLNSQGYLRTLEGSPRVAKVAQETLASLNFSNTEVVIGSFQKTLQKVLEDSKPIDYFFNDGHHDHDAVIQYFNQAMPYLSENAVVAFDDINWSDGMRKAWKQIEADERVGLTIDLGAVGIAVLGGNLTPKMNLSCKL